MPRRSRGCAECRKRRIGCDGGAPICRQCRVTGRQCSGPLQGVFIINQTDRVVARNRQQATLLPQPSHQSVFAQAFIAEFVSFITARNEHARRQSWLAEIQRGSIVDEGLAIDLSMQATALAYCGAAANNPAAVREACRIYGRALSKHSTSIAQDSNSLRAASLYTCVMLSLFEAICSTNPAAYGTHLRAAQKMLALVPREAGGTHGQIISQLSQHVQCQTLFTMIASTADYVQQTPLPASWAKPCLGHDDPDMSEIIERLMGCLHYLTDIFIRISHGPNNELFIDGNVSVEVEGLWHLFQEQATQSGERIEWPVPAGTQYQDPYMAMVVAFFAASRMLLDKLGIESLGQFSPVDASDAILESCRYFEGKEIGCAHLRLFFPLTLVAIHGALHSQRDAAQRILGQRLRNTAFKGLGSAAVKRAQECPALQRLHLGIQSVEA